MKKKIEIKDSIILENEVRQSCLVEEIGFFKNNTRRTLSPLQQAALDHIKKEPNQADQQQANVTIQRLE